MFRFIHTYTEAAFPLLGKSGLWRDGDGLKLMHKPGFLPPYDFNTIAAVGSKLNRLIEELNCPFYVDRLQGGLANTNTYAFDPSLVERYEDVLGDRFLGFQMHEWASNYRSDQQRILSAFRENGVSDGDPSSVKQFWRHVSLGLIPLFLEAYSPAEWAVRDVCAELALYLSQTEKLYALRTEQTRGLLFPTDSYYMAPRTEIACGAKLLMPEAGWQIPNLRAQVAYTRGMSDGAGIPWGIYYECWQNTKEAGFTIPFSLREGQDEWLEDLLHKGNGKDLPFRKREYGGSSLSLLGRVWRYVYFSGARQIAEEYGVCNTFRSLSTGELSPYGEKKREFLRFTERFPDVGRPFRPIAVVLPRDLPMLDVRFPEQWYDFSFDCDAAPVPQTVISRINETIPLLFGRTCENGNQGHVLKNGGLPDVFDIVHEDTPGITNYSYLIDLTADSSFSQNHGNIVSLNDIDALLDLILPLRPTDGVHTVYNKTDEGWLILCMNHDGVFHDSFSPDVFLPEATVRSSLVLKKEIRSVEALDGDGVLQTDNGEFSILLRAGEWILLFVR